MIRSVIPASWLSIMVAGSLSVLLPLGSSTVGHAQTATSGTAPSAGPPTSVLDDPFVRTQGKKGLDLLYNMQFEEAQDVFNKIDRRYPSHPVGAFLDGLRLWWTIMLDLADPSHDEAFYEQMDEVIARSDSLLNEDPDHFDAALFKGAAYGFRARLASNRENWWKALQNGRKAIDHVQSAAEDAPPGNGDYVFGKGLYDYYTAVLEEEYTMAKMVTWMIPDGDRARGIRLLKQTARTGRYVRTEAIYYLTQIYYLYEEDYTKSLQYAKRLRQRHPKNPFFHVLEGRIYARWGRWDRARNVFASVVRKCKNEMPGYTVRMEEIARYYLGRERLYEDAYDEALEHFARLQRLPDRGVEENQFRTMGVLYQGMTYDGMGRRALAKKHYRAVLELNDPGGVHDRAEQYLDEPYS